MKPEDRILRYALQRLLAGESRRPDLSERVVRAWRERAPARERTQGAPAPEPLEGVAPAPPQATERGSRSQARARSARPWLAAAASLAGLAALGLFARSRGGASTSSEPEAPVSVAGTGADASEPARAPVRAEAPLVRFQGSAVASAEGLEPGALVRELRAGELVTVPSESPPVRVRFPAGAVLTAWPEAVFSLEEAGATVRLAAGTARLARPARPATHPAVSGAFGPRLDAGFAALAPLPGGVVLAHVESDDPAATALAPAALAALPEGPRLFTVEVSAGLAELETPRGVERLVERSGRALSSAPAEQSLAAGERALLSELLLQIARGRGDEKPATAPAGGVDLAERDRLTAEEQLFALLDARPTRWVLLSEVAAEALGERPPWYRAAVLDVLASSSNPRALSTLRALWPEHGAAFNDALLIALFGRGAPEIDRELAARAASWSEGDGPPPALAAAWLARRGDGAGRAALEAAAALPGRSSDELLARIHGSLGLAALGEPRALQETIGALASSGLELLEGGAFERARELAMTLDLLAPAGDSDAAGEVPLIGFWERVDAHALRHPERFADAAAVRRLLESRP